MRINSYNLDLSSKHGYSTTTATSVQSSSKEEETVRLTTKERESLELSAVGSAKTGQGDIYFNLKDNALFESSVTVEMSRKKQSLESMVDPLVINLGGGLAKLDAKEKFGFDINADGKKDKISLLAGENGFLAFDKNGDQTINDGSELFGAKSGDGFAELASYDSTKDGVIDENDDIFSKLKIWIKTAGTDKLLTLKEAKVGALLLDNVSSEFFIRGEDDINAKIQKSGVALMENGKAGWMSHVDFAVEQESEANEAESKKIKISVDANKNITHATTDAKTKTTETATETITQLKQKLKELDGKLRNATDEDARKLLSLEKTRLAEQIAALERVESKISA
jgi:hypothetical protein